MRCDNQATRIRSFTILPEDQDAALAIRSPAALRRRLYADMEIHVAAKVRHCSRDSRSPTGDDSDEPNSGKKRRPKKKEKKKKAGSEDGGRGQDERFKYFWSVEGPTSADLSARTGPELRLDRGTLQA